MVGASLRGHVLSHFVKCKNDVRTCVFIISLQINSLLYSDLEVVRRVSYLVPVPSVIIPVLCSVSNDVLIGLRHCVISQYPV